MSVPIIATPPAIPSKYDVIPIHTSDTINYMRCRRYWSWSSPTRSNLRHKVRIFGVSFPLWYGTGIHYALENYYNPVLQRDPVESFITWFTLQWEGGVIPAAQLELSYDINPVCVDETAQLWRIEGLRDMLPNPDEEEFAAFKNLGIGMMTFYKDYAARNDDFQVIAAESSYSIPLGFESVDLREQSPNYGQMLEVHARGKRDAIVYRPSVDRFGIIDHKTAGQIDDNYFQKLEKDEQCSNYIWASEEEAKIHDLPWKEISEICYNALRKTYPKPPTPLSDGVKPSLSRTTEGTTAQLFEAYIKEHNLLDWYNDNIKAKNYYTWLLEVGDKNFIQRDYARRNEYERKATGEHIKAIAKEMLNEPAIYPHPSGDWLCTRCAFRTPCLAKDDGSDWMGILEDAYERNRDR